jgi:hypothetical protein
MRVHTELLHPRRKSIRITEKGGREERGGGEREREREKERKRESARERKRPSEAAGTGKSVTSSDASSITHIL